MNCPSRADPDAVANGWNQNPNPLALDTNADGNGIVNQRRRHRDDLSTGLTSDLSGSINPALELIRLDSKANNTIQVANQAGGNVSPSLASNDGHTGNRGWHYFKHVTHCAHTIRKFVKFIGPGFMVAVAYIDPGNYATDASAGASFRFQLLFMVLLSNIIAIYLQSLCVKLGSVTGLNLAENIKEHCPRWLNYTLYFFAEAAIIATDIAEVIGTAIALDMLGHIPLVAGCALSILDVLVLLLFYKPSGSTIGVRAFECFVILLVLAVAVCFCVELSLIHVPNVGEVFKGFLPSSTIVQSQGLVQACGILGATVMPHSLYLGSGIVQPRLREYDEAHGSFNAPRDNDNDVKYRPSVAAIRYCLSYSIAELVLSLFTVALFVNSAILIVCGASLYNMASANSASLFGIHDLLSNTLAPAAGTIFALGLLFSGTSAGIVCTIAGQIVSEGQLNWTVRPWIRRLVTRSISITPSIIIAAAVGQNGLTHALQGTQVALSIILPFTSAPLIWLTCRKAVMTVYDPSNITGVNMQNNLLTAILGSLIWLLIVVLNVALIVLTAIGVN
ncbi:natural resistance-associated macrophage protein 1, putative [Talaromyces stipitatus ATCC 10500]|uniref:Natural resistance-associated macrophage protein 1, putative n=1 Tax=Talaromyces stipitatus (strain ATCC 10500 / CBS 375.48 / QM 6759 / NRRL 1006) TaxID=441959 RepID=B8M2B9_TALSN|nr:natural resistance-associated macrophage protein 1, putative [Talaromyces stipitatus ATCC 10500]EED21583.1 natural resistance-associated macrophage protein 1, putative [Talaromyces stipitatus ATCC 10500]